MPRFCRAAVPASASPQPFAARPASTSIFDFSDSFMAAAPQDAMDAASSEPASAEPAAEGSALQPAAAALEFTMSLGLGLG